MLRRSLLLTTASALIAIAIWIGGFRADSASAGPATQARAAPLSPEEEKRQMQAQFGAQANRLPAVRAGSMAEVMHFSVASDMLSAQLLLKDPPPLVRISIPSAGLITTLQTLPPMRHAMGGARAGVPGAGRSLGFMMSSRDFSQPDSMSVFTTVSSTAGRVEVSRDYESAKILGSTQLIEDAPPMFGQQARPGDPVRLFVRRTNEITQQDELRLNLSAPTFVALLRTYPVETEKYLRPIFHDLGQEANVFAPNPAAVWQVLADDWQPDENLSKSVNATIAQFDADDFRERESAAHALHQMGEPAALTLMHTDRTQFSAAVSSGVDTFLAPYLPLPPQMAKKLGADRDFLLDSQYCDDLALRRLAAARLAKVTGQPLGFDPAADDNTRLTQIERLRAATPATAATTSP